MKDVVIIGGGLGGLTAGALLSKRGKSVVLIEQYSVVGGYATTFHRKDFRVEVGLHELDGLNKTDLKREIFEYLDVFKNIEFVKIPEFYKFKKNNFEITIPNNFEKAKSIFLKNFPNETIAIEKFFKKIKEIGKEVEKLPTKENKLKAIFLLPFFPFIFPTLVFDSKKSIGEFLDSITKNNDLKLALTANIGYYHNDPYELSLLYFGIAQYSFFQGGYFIKGGSQNLSNYLRDIILKNGGEIILKHLVTDILIENGKAIGVKYLAKNGKTEKQEIKVKSTIFNGAIPNLLEMLPNREGQFLKNKIHKLKLSPSILTLYLGFDRPLKELGNDSYSTMFYSDNSKFGDIVGTTFALCDYSQIDSGLSKDGKSFAVIIEIDFMKNWKDLTEEEYKRKKSEKVEELLSKLEKEIPNTRQHIIYAELATPKTNKRYTLNPEGAIYGFAQLPNQSFLKRIQNRSHIPNLYYASAWTMPGGGFTGAILSGYFASLEIDSPILKR